MREEILIKKGWKLHRIWSTDWFKNRDHEEERLLNVINELSSKIELVPPKKALEKPIKIDTRYIV